MDILIRIVALIISVISICCIVIIAKNIVDIKKMQQANKKVSEYLKDKSYLVMQNDGDDPCDISKAFTMPLFSQDSEYIVRGQII